MKTKLALSALVLSFAACATVTPTVPEGFAVLEDTTPFQAVHANGVLFQARVEPHEPKSDLAFWGEALEKRMVDAGYHLQQKGEINSANLPGRFVELRAPVGDADYVYWVGVFVRGDDLVVFEFSGEVSAFETVRENLTQSVRTSTL